MLKPLIIAALLLVALAAGASGRDLTDAEKTALAGTVAGFDTAMKGKDVPTIIATVPRKVFDHIAAENGIETDALISMVIQQTTEVMAATTFDSFSMDLSAATYKETPDGTPYALIPTVTVMDLGTGTKMKATSETFAMLDEGTWYLVRTNDPGTLEIIKTVYPTYAAEVFPDGTMEPAE